MNKRVIFKNDEYGIVEYEDFIKGKEIHTVYLEKDGQKIYVGTYYNNLVGADECLDYNDKAIAIIRMEMNMTDYSIKSNVKSLFSLETLTFIKDSPTKLYEIYEELFKVDEEELKNSNKLRWIPKK